MASKQADNRIKGAKGDSAKERRLTEALRANLMRRKAQARAVASDIETQARGQAEEGREED